MYDVFGYGKDVKKYRKVLGLFTFPKDSHVDYILKVISL
jgi:hypothetical protein